MKTRWSAAAVLGMVVTTLCAQRADALPPDVCIFNVVSGVNFGIYDVFNAAPTTANGVITYSCANFPPAGETVNLRFTRGNAPTYNPRFMLNGAQQLQYNLYRDPVYTLIWGDGTAGTSFYSANTLNGVLTTVTIYGRITAGQDLTAGAYSDTIKVTIEW